MTMSLDDGGQEELDLSTIAEQNKVLTDQVAAQDKTLKSVEEILRQVVASQRKPDEPSKKVDDGLTDLPEDHPVVKTLRAQAAEIARLSNEAQVEKMTKQQQAAYDAALNSLQKVAKVAGVDFSEVEGSIKELPLDSPNWWDTAVELIGNHKTQTTEEQRPSNVRAFTERRGGSGGRSMTFDQLEEGYTNGTVSTEKYAAELYKRGI